ncbi:MAG: hypothetical protein A2Z98_16565 [Spirochaetes bacterium GWB1_27_13]|nr:MAG: hypothetical protein A2Z98_16565 [Spirochaetes bacterium GWB1_27_13]
MGLFINLYFQPKCTQEEWEKVWNECHNLLMKYPVPLMRIDKQKLDEDTKRFVLTRNLIADAGKEEERWDVIGDWISRKYAENFFLYKNLKQQTSSLSRSFPKDILWADEKELDYINGNGITLFDSKTQQYPYHLAILAVGILFEHFFPNESYIIGDIDDTQAEIMTKWINSVTNYEVKMPICFDAERLWNRLDSLYENKELLISRFQTLYKGDEKKLFKIIVQNASNEIFINFLAKDLAEYSSLSQWGAKDILNSYLQQTKDLEGLINLVLKAQEKKLEKEKKEDIDEKEFSLEKLLKVLCNGFVTISLEDREPLDVFAQKKGKLVTMQETFTLLFSKMSGLPSDINFYMNKEDIINIFLKYEKYNEVSFRNTIEECEKKCYEELNNIKEIIELIDKKLEEDEKTENKKEQSKKSTDNKPWIPNDRILTPEEKYIFEQTDRQIVRHADVEESTKIMGQIIQRCLDEDKKSDKNYFLTNDRTDLIKKIYYGNHHNGFVLKETAWEEIDKEQDIAILQRLAILASLQNSELTFWNWRMYIMENKELWKYLIDCQEISSDITIDQKK